MSYTTHDFKDGDYIMADDVNEMDSQIAENSSDLSSHTANVSNPHGVTASQVGLGNVPNKATNDQTPTYTTATSLTAMTSGEKLSVAFGKLAKAVSDLISHTANVSNPHGVTASQVGAAASSHTHTASTITNLGALNNGSQSYTFGGTTETHKFNPITLDAGRWVLQIKITGSSFVTGNVRFDYSVGSQYSSYALNYGGSSRRLEECIIVSSMNSDIDITVSVESAYLNNNKGAINFIWQAIRIV